MSTRCTDTNFAWCMCSQLQLDSISIFAKCGVGLPLMSLQIVRAHSRGLHQSVPWWTAKVQKSPCRPRQQRDKGLCKKRHRKEDVDSHSDDVQATPHGSQVCLVLMAAEWDALISGKERAILRPFQMHHGKTTIIVRNPEGHVVVGSVQWLESERFSHFSETRVAKLCSVVYKDTKQLAQMKQNKEKHIWKCKDVVAFKPYVARFLDVAPRYRNRPFIVKDQELFAHSSCDSFPKKLDLDDTARYFWSLLDEKMQLALRTTFRAVAKIRNTIRIGTTCSGTDVCIPVIKACVAFFNSLEAG